MGSDFGMYLRVDKEVWKFGAVRCSREARCSYGWFSVISPFLRQHCRVLMNGSNNISIFFFLNLHLFNIYV